MSVLEEVLKDPEYKKLPDKERRVFIGELFDKHVSTDPDYQKLGDPDKQSFRTEFFKSAGVSDKSSTTKMPAFVKDLTGIEETKNPPTVLEHIKGSLPTFNKNMSGLQIAENVAKTAALPLTQTIGTGATLVRNIPGVEPALQISKRGASGAATLAATGDISKANEAIAQDKPFERSVGELASRLGLQGDDIDQYRSPSVFKQFLVRIPQGIGEVFAQFIDPEQLPAVGVGTAIGSVPAVAKELPKAVGRVILDKATREAATKMRAAGYEEGMISEFEKRVSSAQNAQDIGPKQAKEILKNVRESEVKPPPAQPAETAAAPELLPKIAESTEPVPPTEAPPVPVEESPAAPPQEIAKVEARAAEDAHADATVNQEVNRQITKEFKDYNDSRNKLADIVDDLDAVKVLRSQGRLSEAGESLPVITPEEASGRIKEIKKNLSDLAAQAIPEGHAVPILRKLGLANTLPQLYESASSISKAIESTVAGNELSPKAAINQSSGIAPVEKTQTIKDYDGLLNQIRAEVRGAKAGYSEGAKVTKEQMIQRFREGQQKISEVTDFIKETLPPEERGKFISAVQKATTAKKQYSLFWRALLTKERIDKASMASEVKELSKPDGRVLLEYQRKITDTLKDIDFSKPTDKTLKALRGLKEYINKNGEPLGISPKRLEALTRLTKKPIKELTASELRELRDTVASLHNLGKLKMELKYKYNERLRQAAIQKLVASTRNIDPAKSANEKATRFKSDALKFYIETLHTPRVADMIDGFSDYSGENAKYIKQLGEQETQAKLVTTTKISNFLDSAAKIKPDWTEEEQAELTFHAHLQQKAFDQAQTLIDVHGWTEAPKITKQMQQVLDLARELMNSNVDKIQSIYEELENKAFEKVENYFPIKYEKEFNVVPSETIEQGRYRKTEVFKGFTFTRRPGVTKVPRTDFFGIIEEALNEQEWYVHMQPILENIKYLFKSPEYLKAGGEHAADFWSRTMDVVSRRGWSATAQSNWTLRQVRMNINLAVLGYKASSILMQPFAVFDALAYTQSRFGPIVAAKLLGEFSKSWINPRYAKSVIGNSPALQMRDGGELAIEEALAVAKKSTRAYKAFVRGSMALLQKADVITAAGAQKAFYEILKKSGLSPEEARKEADFLMNIVSGSNEVSYRPLMLSKSEGARAWFTFQSFFLNRWGLIAQDTIAKVATSGSYKTKLYALIGLGIIIAGNVAEQAAKRKIFEFIKGKKPKTPFSATKVALTTIPSQIPFFGNLFDIFAGKPGGATPPALQILEDSMRGIKNLATGKKKSTRISGAVQAAKGALSIYPGIPGTSQVFDLLQGMLNR